jgi:hypothetical protein
VTIGTDLSLPLGNEQFVIGELLASVVLERFQIHLGEESRNLWAVPTLLHGRMWLCVHTVVEGLEFEYLVRRASSFGPWNRTDHQLEIFFEVDWKRRPLTRPNLHHLQPLLKHSCLYVPLKEYSSSPQKKFASGVSVRHVNHAYLVKSMAPGSPSQECSSHIDYHLIHEKDWAISLVLPRFDLTFSALSCLD